MASKKKSPPQQEGQPSSTIRLDQLQLLDAQFVECAITNHNETPLVADELHDFEFSCAVGHKQDLKQGIVGIELRIGLKGLNAEQALLNVEGRFWIRFTFKVNNASELLGDKAEDSSANLPPAVYLLLLSVAYSTARGMLMGKTSGTPLQGVILPIVDVRDLLKEKL